ncbi:tRNA lysidine(34) synthetase TilS [Vibrio sp. S4M6]|uniref:tRNA lysidine(34) synthetase TilS n=1 Tax=Vibrio sinus TaxID=2946865 RepID=UPI002029B53C|nr:tRNA lysidine(34) synthetase TilS [Vibrio sinus]MCL9782157.1 tRNA lysidine(34) synthetase TilS [Vibrio sinus]
MSSIHSTFAQTLSQFVSAESRLVIAFSGGVDSRVLLELSACFANQQSLDCIAIHVNHGLSRHASAWSAQCQSWCDEYNIPLVIETVSLDLSQGESVEKLARDERYKALGKHINPNDIVLTGQHANDQLETFLLALKRGSGPKGLAAMPESKAFYSGKIVRPLLGVARQEIEQYANERGMDWIEDESNQDVRFDRNFIRHQVTPTLVQRWPSFAQSIRRSAHLCAEQEALLEELLQESLHSLLDSKKSIDIDGLAQHSDRARWQLIRMWMSQSGYLMPSYEQLKKIWHEVALSAQDANPQLNTSDCQVRRFNNRLYILSEMMDVSSWSAQIYLDTPLQLPDKLGYVTLSGHSATANLSIPSNMQQSLSITFNPEGLSAHPVERNHSRKLKKLFQEYQVPSWQRRRTPILMCGGKVVAVAGLFVDRAFEGQDCEIIWDNIAESV